MTHFIRLQAVIVVFTWLSVHAEQTNISYILGASTNGMYATGSDWEDAPSGGHLIIVNIHFIPPFTNTTSGLYRKARRNTNGVTIVEDPSNDWRYFKATNGFCGFVQLRDADGREVGMIRPQMNVARAYPPSYSLQDVRHQLMSKTPVSNRPPLPNPLVGEVIQLSFRLKDYFAIKTPGLYQLTIWPKIYQRTETNTDICRRIDLQPVTIPIQWK
jgi:hypothetical protein